MKRRTLFRTPRRLLTLACAWAAALWTTAAGAAGKVVVTDFGAHTSTAGPTAPKHIIGLPRTFHTIVIDTGARRYGLQYVVAHDKKRPGVAIPGEGYIGMPKPSNQNWYAGGFFDLQINGHTIGTTPVHAFLGRSNGSRGRVDYVFDTTWAVVRIRFVGLAGDDALYCQALLEPKTPIRALRLALRCYPSAYVSKADRHVLTPVRDLAQGRRAALDLKREWWLLYYDRIFDAGYRAGSRTGAGPCAVLWPRGQAKNARVDVGSYGVTTILNLDPGRRDFRFVFFDYRGVKNAAAIAALRGRAAALERALTAFSFADASVARWPFESKRAEAQKLLAALPGEKEAAARYRRWAEQLAAQLPLVRSGAPGAILAEATAASIIQQWDRGLAELKLKALLGKI